MADQVEVDPEELGRSAGTYRALAERVGGLKPELSEAAAAIPGASAASSLASVQQSLQLALAAWALGEDQHAGNLAASGSSYRSTDQVGAGAYRPHPAPSPSVPNPSPLPPVRQP